MNITYVCHYFVPEPAAPAARVHEFARAWVRAGHAVDVLTTFPNHPVGRIPAAYRGTLWATEWLDGIRVLRCWLYAVPNRGVGRRGLDHLSFMLTALLVRPAAASGRSTWSIASSPTLFSATVRLADRAHPTRAVRPRSARPVARSDRRPRPDAARGPTVKSSGAWPRSCTPGRARRRGHRSLRRPPRAQGVPRRKLAVIPNGADTRFFAPRVADPRPDADAPGAGPERPVRAWRTSAATACRTASTRSSTPPPPKPDVTFLLVGDGADRDRLVAERDRRHLRKRDHAPERRPKAKSRACTPPPTPAWCRCATCRCSRPSCPSKLFEVLAAGRPGDRRRARRGPRHPGALGRRAAGRARARRSTRRGRRPSARRSCAGQPSLASAAAPSPQQHYDRDQLASRYLDLLREVVRPTPDAANPADRRHGFSGQLRRGAPGRTSATVGAGASDQRSLGPAARRRPARGHARRRAPAAGRTSTTVVYCASMGFGHVPRLVDQLQSAGVRRGVFVSTTAIFTSLPAASRAPRLEAEAAVENSTLDWTHLAADDDLRHRARPQHQPLAAISHALAVLSRVWQRAVAAHLRRGPGRRRWSPRSTARHVRPRLQPGRRLAAPLR